MNTVVVNGENYIAEASFPVDELERGRRTQARIEQLLEMTLGCKPSELYVTRSVVPDMVIDVTILMLIAGGDWRNKGREWRDVLGRV